MKERTRFMGRFSVTFRYYISFKDKNRIIKMKIEV